MLNTIVYMVRHGESPKSQQNERTRGLTEKGLQDAVKITELLKKENIDVLVSSPYERSKLTIQGLATILEKEIVEYEALKECVFVSGGRTLSNKEIYPLAEKMFCNRDFSVGSAESFNQCQSRAIHTLEDILETYKHKEIVIGTHGFIMTAIMNFFDSKYDFNFLKQTTKPDIYKLVFSEVHLLHAERIWAKNDSLL